MTKERLKEYRHLVKEMKELKEDIVFLESKCGRTGNIISDMPKGGIITDYEAELGDAVLKLVEIERILKEQIIDIRLYISCIPRSVTRRIFRLRYMKGMDWDDIGEETGYSGRHVRRIHDTYYNKLS